MVRPVVLLTVGGPVMLMLGWIYGGCEKKLPEERSDSLVKEWKNLRDICEKGGDKKDAAEFIKKQWCKKKDDEACDQQRIKLVEETVKTTHELLTEATEISCEDEDKAQHNLKKAARLLRSRKKARHCLKKNEHRFRTVEDLIESDNLMEQFKKFKKLKEDPDLFKAIEDMKHGALKEELIEYRTLSTQSPRPFLELSNPGIRIVLLTQELRIPPRGNRFREAGGLNGERKGKKRAKPMHLWLE